MTRMADLRQGFDVEDTSISNVEESLGNIGIKLRDSETSFRNFSDVLEELAGKWNTLTELQQSDIAKQIAGTRQRNIFFTLMTNMNKALEFQALEANSAGVAMERYGVYLDGVEASANRLQSSWEGLWQATINPGVFTFFNNLLASILNLITAMGGLIPLITAVVSSFSLMNGPAVAGAFIALKTKLSEIVTALMTVEGAAASTGAVLATSLGAVGLAITAVVVGYNLFQSAVEDSEEKIARLNKELEESTSKLKNIKDSQKALNDLGKRYDELKIKSKLNNDEQQEFIDIQNRIKDILPQVQGTYDQLGNFVMNTTVKVANLNKELERQRKNQEDLVAAQAKQSINENLRSIEQEAKALDDVSKRYEYLLEYVNNAKENNLSVAPEVQADLKRMEIEFKSGKVALDESLSEIYTLYSQMEPTVQKEFMAMLDAGNDFQKRLAIQMRGISESFSEGLIPESGAEEVIKTFAETIKEIDDATSALVDAMKESNSEQGLSSETIQKLIEENEDYIDMLEFEGDKITLNKHAVRQHTIAIIDEKIAMAESTDATGRKATILRALKKQMMENINGIRELRDAEEDYKDILDLVIDRIREKKEQEKEAIQGQIDAMKDNLNEQKDIIEENLNALKEKYESEKEMIQDSLDLLKEKLDAEKEASEARLDALEKEKDAQEEINKTQIETLEASVEKEKEQINVQLENQKKILEARKEAIDLLKEEIDYQDELADKQKGIAQLQAEIEELRLDNSLEARAKRLQLEDQLSGKQKELSTFQRDKAITDEKRAIDDEIAAIEESSSAKIEAIELEYKTEKEILDKRLEDLATEYDKQKEIEDARIKLLEDQYEQQEKLANARTKSIEDEVSALEKASEQKIKLLEQEAAAREAEFEKQIAAIDEYLKQNGTIIKEAMKQLAEGNSSLYQELIDWNSKYGSGIDTDITEKWVGAIAKAQEYLDIINGIKSVTGGTDEYVPATGSTMGGTPTSPYLPSDPWQNIPVPSYHSGAAAGPVAGKTNAAGEQFAKLMAGEVVTTPSEMDRFIRKTLPLMLSGDFKHLLAGGDSNVNIGSLITVEGNLDQTVMPDLNAMVDKAIVKLTESFKQKGMIRRTQSYA